LLAVVQAEMEIVVAAVQAVVLEVIELHQVLQ
jgi:hypothetical protein